MIRTTEDLRRLREQFDVAGRSHVNLRAAVYLEAFVAAEDLLVEAVERHGERAPVWAGRVRALLGAGDGGPR